jgi:hypothetical protein
MLFGTPTTENLTCCVPARPTLVVSEVTVTATSAAAVVSSPPTTVIEVLDSDSDSAVDAFDGTTDSIPNPNAATATSAMRLKVVFVDICFLSISRVREFPELGFG